MDRSNLSQRNSRNDLKKDEEVYEIASEVGLFSSKSFIMEKDSDSRRNIQVQSDTAEVKSHSKPSSSPNTNKKTLKKARLPSMMALPLRPATAIFTSDSKSIIDSLKSQLSFQNSKAFESREKQKKMSKTLENLQIKISDLQNALKKKNSEIEDKNERIILAVKTSAQERNKATKLQAQLESSRKTINELREILKAKDMKFIRSEAKNQSLRKECKQLMMSNESLVEELNIISKKIGKNFSGKEEELLKENEKLKNELNSRDLKVDLLEIETQFVKEENVRQSNFQVYVNTFSLFQTSLKQQLEEISQISDDPTEISDPTKLHREILSLRSREVKLKAEISLLKSQLDINNMETDTKHLQLKGNFVMKVEDQSKSDKSLLVLKVKSMEQIEQVDEVEEY